jgi:hypothetical protein
MMRDRSQATGHAVRHLVDSRVTMLKTRQNLRSGPEHNLLGTKEVAFDSATPKLRMLVARDTVMGAPRSSWSAVILDSE